MGAQALAGKALGAIQRMPRMNRNRMLAAELDA